MTATNDVTGDSIRSKIGSDDYRNNYDKIFRKETKLPEEKKEDRLCSSNRNCEKECDGGCE